MTDAEIKELSIKHGLCQPSGDQFTAIDIKQLSFAKELEALIREKVLAELIKDNPPIAIVNVMDRSFFTNWNSFDKCKLADGKHNLYAMPPVPEGMQLVPIEPTEAMIEACFDLVRCEWTDPKRHFVSHYKTMVAAAKKG